MMKFMIKCYVAKMRYCIKLGQILRVDKTCFLSRAQSHIVLLYVLYSTYNYVVLILYVSIKFYNIFFFYYNVLPV